MMSSSSIANKMTFRKRKINSALDNLYPSSTNYKSNSNIILLNSQKFPKKQKNKSQIQLKYNSFGFDSMKNTSFSCRQKLLTPQKRINLKNSSTQNDIPKLFDINSIYNSIISKIENLINNYKKDMMKLYYVLTNIENFINSISQEDELLSQEKNVQKSFSANPHGNLYKYNLESIDEKDNKHNSPKNSNNINLSNNNLLEGEQPESDAIIYKRKINKLIIKINEMENKFKIEKLKYLFCIGEYQKKINELEKKLNMNSIDKMPKKELKKFLCYPHYVKFDVNEDINPKSVPMFNIVRKKKKCYSSIHDNRVNKRNLLSKSDNDNGNSFDFDSKGNNKDKDNNNIAPLDLLNEFKKNNIHSNKHSHNHNSNINNAKIDLNDIEEENLFFDKEKDINFEEVKNTIELGKLKFDSKIQTMDRFFGKSKNFFVSHPKLNYIKSLNDGNKMASWKLENQINSLPKQISKLKILSKSQKNQIVVFPSFLNETMVNLEKLRTNKNFRSIENKFEETFKIKIKN